MPVAVTFSGRPSVSRRWQARAVVSGLLGSEANPELVIYFGSRADATPPTKPSDLTLVYTGRNVTYPLGLCVKTLTRDAAGEGRWTITQTYGPGDMDGLVAGARVYCGVSESEDPTDDFIAVSAPLRATY